MRILKISSTMILIIALGHIAYGVLAIYLASLDAADLSRKIFNEITATGATWVEWKRTFFLGGIYTIAVGVVAIIAGIGVFKAKIWGRTVWLLMSPVLLLKQFAEGQKSLTYFNSRGNYDLAFVLLIIVAFIWILLLLPSSRRVMSKITEQPDPRDRFAPRDP